jgi:hypothetical protein
LCFGFTAVEGVRQRIHRLAARCPHHLLRSMCNTITKSETKATEVNQKPQNMKR